MTDFYIPARYDEAAAEDGIWHTVEDEMGNEHGRFLVTLMDSTSPRYKNLVEKSFRTKYPTQPGRPNKKWLAFDEDERMRILFVEFTLHDWELKDKSGKAVPFAKATAMQYLNANPFAFQKLLIFANDVCNFQPEDQAELPEGN